MNTIIIMINYNKKFLLLIRMNCVSCLLWCKENDSNDEEKNSLVFPDTMIVYVKRVIFGNKILVTYKDNNITYHYYVKMHNIIIPQSKNSLVIYFLKNFIENKNIIIKNIKIVDYSDIVADIYYNDMSINELLLRNKFAITKD